MKYKLSIKCLKSSKSDSTYVVLGVDLGYRFMSLTMDKATIVELTSIPFVTLANMVVGEVTDIGYVEIG